MVKTTKRKYVAAPGAGYSNKDAAVIGRELEKLGQIISPPQVVAAARSRDSALHPFFEWNNSVAAEKYRVYQARNVLNHLQVVVVMPSGEQAPLKAYFSQTIEGEDADGEASLTRRYLHIDLVSSQPASAENAIEDAKAELEAWRERYAEYKKFFAPVFQAIKKIK